MELYWFESHFLCNPYLEFPQGWSRILFRGLIVLDSDSVFSHNWWFFPSLACPCQLRPYYEIPLTFSPVFLFLLFVMWRQIPCVSSPWLMIKAEYRQTLAWLGGMASRGWVLRARRRYWYDNPEHIFPTRAVKLGATTYTTIFICKARDIEYLW